MKKRIETTETTCKAHYIHTTHSQAANAPAKGPAS